MKRSGIVFAFIVIFSISCINESNDVKTAFNIDFNNTVLKDVRLAGIADSLYYIFLQFDKHNPVGRIAHFKVSHNYIFIADHRNKLFVFKKNGEVCSVLNKTGKGPGEYISIEDFTISDDERFIYILDPGNKKIIKCTLSGEYVNSYPLKYSHAAHIEILRDGCFCIYQSARFSDDNSSIYITDSLFNLKKKIFYDGDQDFLRRIPYLIDVEWYRFNNNIYFREPFQSTVYRIDQAIGLDPYINIDFGNRGIPDYAYEDTKLYQDIASECYQLKDIVESENYFFLKVFYQNVNHQYLYIKKDNELIRLKSPGLVNDPDDTAYFWPQYIDESNIMYSIDYADELFENTGSHNAVIDFEKTVGSNENPIIVCVELIYTNKNGHRGD
jgi:hypothetical protein